MHKLFLLLTLVLFPVTVLADSQETIDRLNQKNAEIRSFTADVYTTIKRRRMSISLYGKMEFEKPRNFRLVNNDVRRRQFSSDLGSNNTYFWFYGKRLNSSQLYFAQYSQLGRTHIKDSLNPVWLIDSLNLNHIDTTGAKVYEQNGKIVVSKVVQSPRRSQVVKVITIDPQRPAIVGHALYTSNRALIASSRVTAFYKVAGDTYIPRSISISWPAEQISISWQFRNPKVNVAIDPKRWVMPALRVQRVDLGTGVRIRGVND